MNYNILPIFIVYRDSELSTITEILSKILNKHDLHRYHFFYKKTYINRRKILIIV